MIPVYNSTIMREWDAFTILNEPLSSVELMERAAQVCSDWISSNIGKDNSIAIVCGNGNNGGDGLVLARLLFLQNYNVQVFIEKDSNRSTENKIQLERLKNLVEIKISEIEHNQLPDFQKFTVLIDCIFGTGLTRSLDGFWKSVLNAINQAKIEIISIDLPSGLFAEPEITFKPNLENTIKAKITLAIQAPKLSMLLADWGNFCGRVFVLDIGLDSKFVKENLCLFQYIGEIDILGKFKVRERVSHKGTYGHALIVAGNIGKCGAAILSSKSCISSGAGLVTLYTRAICSISVHAGVPEIMIQTKKDVLNLETYSSIAIGPGIGTGDEQLSLLKKIIINAKCPLLLDADALTLISKESENLNLPSSTIITPHPKEFERLAGSTINSYDRLQKAIKLAIEKNITVILKDAVTAICSPDGTCYFNSTGNPGMATAGSGDVLTGVISAFLAQGYSPLDACILGVYCHGKAGDYAAKNLSTTGMKAGDIIDNLNLVFKELEGKKSSFLL
jgi:hydroxyethylthiazole kinase-like uncharacterized protein yjeF